MNIINNIQNSRSKNPFCARKASNMLPGDLPSPLYSNFIVDGNNRLLVVVIVKYPMNDSQISSVRWNGSEELTRIAITNNFDSNGRLSVWYLVNPTATTANIDWTHTLAAMNHLSFQILLFNNVNQITPVGTAVTVFNNTNNQSVSVTANIGDMVFAVASQYTTPWAPIAQGQNEILRMEQGSRIRVSSSFKRASSTTELMRQGTTSSLNIGMIGFSIRKR